MARKRSYQSGVYLGLAAADKKRLMGLSAQQSRTQTEVAREALRWYMENYEEMKHQSREGQMAEAMRYATVQIIKAINSGVDRICAMLARQGRAIGTLYELQYMAIPDSDQADALFAEAVEKAKRKQAKYIEEDEKELVERKKAVVKGQVKAEN